MWSASVLSRSQHSSGVEHFGQPGQVQIGSRSRVDRRRRSQSGGSDERRVLPFHATFG